MNDHEYFNFVIRDLVLTKNRTARKEYDKCERENGKAEAHRDE